MQDVKSEASSNLVKLCFIILTCIAEDQYANALMSDPHLVFRVRKLLELKKNLKLMFISIISKNMLCG
jgi:hypothetical protein